MITNSYNHLVLPLANAITKRYGIISGNKTMKLGENGDTSLSPMGSLQRVVIWMKDGQEMEVYDNPKAYDIIMA